MASAAGPGFSFGSAGTGAFGSTPTGSSSSSNTGSSTGTGTAGIPSTTTATMELPKFDTVFPHLLMWTRLNPLLGVLTSSGSSAASGSGSASAAEQLVPSLTGQELMHWLTTPPYKTVLLQPTLPQQWTANAPQQLLQQNATWFQKLSQVPTVSIPTQDTVNASTANASSANATATAMATTTLPPKILLSIFQLATDLGIPYPQAASLYAQVSGDLPRMQHVAHSLAAALGGNGVNGTEPPHLSSSTPSTDTSSMAPHHNDLIGQTCRDLYAYECLLPFHMVVQLVHTRIIVLPPSSSTTTAARTTPHHQQHRHVLQATDLLLQQRWIEALLSSIKECTRTIQLLQTDIQQQQQQQQQQQHQQQHHHHHQQHHASTFLFNNNDNNRFNTKQMQLKIVLQARHMIGEALFFLAYHTQWDTPEVNALMDQIHELSQLVGTPENNYNPFIHVPYPYIDQTMQTLPSSWYSPAPAPSPFSSSSIKTKQQWTTEFVQQQHQSLTITTWQALSLLIVTAQAALDGTHPFWCRTRHDYQPVLGNKNTLDTHALQQRLLGMDYSSHHHQLHNHQQQQQQHHTTSTILSQHPRPDIASLLATSLLLLLHSQQQQQRDQHYPSPPPIITAPSDFKAFTFARVTLVPYLKTLSSRSNDSSNNGSTGNYNLNLTEFALATLTLTYGQYLEQHAALSSSSSGDLVGVFPVSRHVWLIEEQEELQLRKDQAIQQAQFAAATHWQLQSLQNYHEQDELYHQGWKTANTNNSSGTTPVGPTATIPTTAATETIPNEVDLMTRPDCLDDIVALGITLAGLGAEYARSFFSNSDTDDDKHRSPSPSKTVCLTLQQLGSHVAKKDPSLLPSYLSWLAALCHDAPSASIVHSMLQAAAVNQEGNATGPTTFAGAGASASDSTTAAATTTTDAPPPPIQYRQIIANLAWYARELSPYGGSNNNGSPSVSQTSASDSKYSSKATSNTSYYYNLDGDSENSYGAYPYGKSTAAVAGSGTAASSDDGTSTANAPKPKVQELSNTSRYFLGSHLALVRNVAQHSSQARLALLKIVLPLDGSGSTTARSSSAVVTGDETLLILFQLAMAPLPPTLRGATLATIASLLLPSPDLSAPDQAFLLEQANRGWEYMENCPLLPIPLLDQYATVDLSKNVGLAMPPSSLKLANASTSSSSKSAYDSLLPKDPLYGLLYEMEHVESQLGWYPATEGCLEVISSLIQTAGCPSSLGQTWRIRPGTAPYLEYVTEFVLPRALGTQGISKLPFRVPGDESRLVTKALHVIQAVIVQYTVPLQVLQPNIVDSISSTMLGMPSENERWVSNRNEEGLVDDFENKTVSSSFVPPQSSSQQTTSSSAQSASPMVVSTLGHIPRAKSPGFVIMADLLSSSAGGGGILEALALVIAGMGGASGVHSIFGSVGDKVALAYASFGTTVPNLSSAIEGAQEGGPTKHMQSYLKSFHPHIDKLVVDDIDFDCGIFWRESSIKVALQILCAVAMREEAFFVAVASSKNPLKIVPTLRFQRIRYGSANLKIVHVSPSRLSTLLHTAPDAQYFRSAIVEYIGYSSADEETDAQLSSAALCLTHFMHTKIRLQGGLQALADPDKPWLLANTAAVRLVISAQRTLKPLAIEATSLILNLILSELRTGTVTDGGQAQVLLGLPSTTKGGNWTPGQLSFANTDCFDAILDILHGADYMASKEQSAVASLCLEILFRLYNLAGNADICSLRIAVYTAQRLRAVEFWTTNLVRLLSCRGSEPLVQAGSLDLEVCNPDALHCFAWLLKAVACEINLLIGFASSSLDEVDASVAELISPRPVMCQQLLDLLFSSHEPLIINLIHNLPMENVSMLSTSVVHPPDDALRKGIQSWPGPCDVASGYFKVNKKIVLATVQSVSSQEQDVAAMEVWIDEWNNVVARNCAASHLSSAVAMMIDAASAGNDAFSSLGSSSSPAIVPPAVLVGLSALILDRLLEGSNIQFPNGMDSSSYANATRSMSNAVLCLIDALLSFDEEKRSIKAIEILPLISLIAKAVAYSSIGDDSDAEAPTRYERTIVLANAMSTLLRHIAHDEPGLLMHYKDDLILAGQALARLASFEVSTVIPESTSVVSILARNCLATMVEICSHDCEGHETSFAFQLLNPLIAHRFSDLVSRIDLSICSFLEIVASQPGGAEILIHARVLDAMESAASSYARQEAEMVAKIQETGEFRQTMVLSPDHLMSHVKLLTTLLASSRPSLSSRSTQALLVPPLPNHAIKILGFYKNTFHRLCSKFPIEADVLRAFLRCLVQAAIVAMCHDSTQPRDALPSLTSSKSSILAVHQVLADFGFLDSTLLVLYRQLLDHPLPPSLLPQVPVPLESPHSAKKNVAWNRVVKVVSSNDFHHMKRDQPTWWDILNAFLKNSKISSEHSFAPPVSSDEWFAPQFSEEDRWSETTFEYAIVAADILGLILTLLRKLHGWDYGLDIRLVCRGVYQYALATKVRIL